MTLSQKLMSFTCTGARAFRQCITPILSKSHLNSHPSLTLRCIQNSQSIGSNGLLWPLNRQCASIASCAWKSINCSVNRTLEQSSVTHMQVRTVTKFSKKGKRKTVKAVAKRFIRTGSGKLKYWPPGKVHNMLAKSRKKRLQLRKARYATKTQLKTLNKMISGW